MLTRLTVIFTLALLAALAVQFPLPGSANSNTSVTLLGDALSGLPNNAAWQGLGNDGTYFYLLTSQNTSTDIVNGKENIIRKYRISDGQLVATKNAAYPDTRTFSSGEVIDGKLHVAVRDASVLSPWAHVAVYDTDDLTLLEDHDIGTVDGYAVPEGVARKDDYYWVVFGGYGNGPGKGNVCAIVKYDLDWNEIAAYELFVIPSGNYFGGQDLAWANNTEIIINLHEDKVPGEDKLDRWQWTGNGFVRTARYQQPTDEGFRTMGQGFTLLNDGLYLAARYSDRIVQVELVDVVKETPTPTPQAVGGITELPAGVGGTSSFGAGVIPTSLGVVMIVCLAACACLIRRRTHLS